MKKLFIFSLIALFSFGCAKRPTPFDLASTLVESDIPKIEALDDIYRLKGFGISHVVLLFPGGELLDPTGKEGAIRLLCASMISGGSKSLGPDKTEELLDDLAAYIEISPQREFTYATMNILDEDTKQGVQLFLDVLKNPSFDQKRIDLERKRLKDEVVRDEEDPLNVAFYELKNHLYKKDPRSKRPTTKSLDTVTRQDIISLHKKIFSSKPLIGIVGSPNDKAIGDIKNAWLNADKGTFSFLGMPEYPEFGSFSKVAKDKQCVLVMAHLAPGMKDSLYPETYIADYIIGSGGLSSRMAQEVRTKRGLAYSTGSFYQARPNWGVFGVYVVTETKHLQEVKQTIANEIFQKIPEEITPEEVTWAKHSILNQFSATYDSPMKILLHSMEMDISGLPVFDATFTDKISHVQTSDIQTVASDLLKGPWVEVIVNP